MVPCCSRNVFLSFVCFVCFSYSDRPHAEPYRLCGRSVLIFCSVWPTCSGTSAAPLQVFVLSFTTLKNYFYHSRRPGLCCVWKVNVKSKDFSATTHCSHETRQHFTEKIYSDWTLSWWVSLQNLAKGFNYTWTSNRADFNSFSQGAKSKNLIKGHPFFIYFLENTNSLICFSHRNMKLTYR